MKLRISKNEKFKKFCSSDFEPIKAAAPTEDTYGVTQLGLKSGLNLFNRLVKGLDIIVRNNQKR